MGRTRLDATHPVIPATTGGGGGCLILFGLPFITVGVVVTLMSLGYLPIDDDEINGPRWLLTAFGGVFASAGLGVAWMGISGMLRERAARRRKEEHPLEPWFWDHPWDQRWAESGSLAPAFQAFLGFLFLAAFLSMFHWWAFFSGEGPLPLKLFIVLFDLIALAVLFGAIYALFQYFKYGKSRLHFARFPFRPGRSLEAGLEANRRLLAADRIAITLRYIEEVIEVTGTGKNRSSRQVLYGLHEVKQELDTRMFQGGSIAEIPIRLRLPEGDYATRLLETPRRYWELEVKAETPGIDYVARFLVPVY
jgi:hypothetical protein